MYASSPSPPGVYAPFVWRADRMAGAAFANLLARARTTALVREGPDPHLFLAYAPQARQAMRLDDEEVHNERAEHHVFNVRGRVHTKRKAQHVRDVGQQHRQQNHEGRTEEASDNGTQPADDDNE